MNIYNFFLVFFFFVEWLPWNSEECTLTCGSQVVLHNRQCSPFGSYCEILDEDGNIVEYKQSQEERREKSCGDNCPGGN